MPTTQSNPRRSREVKGRKGAVTLVEADEHDGVGHPIDQVGVHRVPDHGVAVDRARSGDMATTELDPTALVAEVLGRVLDRVAAGALPNHDLPARKEVAVRFVERRQHPSFHMAIHEFPQSRQKSTALPGA